MNKNTIKEIRKYLSVEIINGEELIGYTDGTYNVRVIILEWEEGMYDISIYNYKEQKRKAIKNLTEQELYKSLDSLIN